MFWYACICIYAYRLIYGPIHMYVYVPVCTVCFVQDDATAKINNLEFNDNTRNNGSCIMGLK
jgi:hypothetical protein